MPQSISGEDFGVKDKVSYKNFIAKLDSRLKDYFELHSDYVHCKEGCSSCCEEGDYPISQPEAEYLMQGYIALDNDTKIKVQNNIKLIKKGGACPFLINNKCSVYPYRPIICRVHGLAYLCKEGTVKLPYCANEGKNYSNVLNAGMVDIAPINENLDTKNLIAQYNSDAVYTIKNLIEWLSKEKA